MMSLSKQQKEFYRTFSQHGTGDAKVEIQARDVALLAHIAYLDVYETSADWFHDDYASLAINNFYEISPLQISHLSELSQEDAFRMLELCGATDVNNVIFLYLKNLSELYRRRFKFYNIMKTQAFPLSDPIGPRCLLEYGRCDDNLLFDWISWRKLAYDLDNRCAQETGYLFEPILASCLGGEPVSHKFSPVRRIDDNGKPTMEGRQIDCYIEEAKEIYELKLRVTIAASGQGRFSEEMTFPYEARMAGLKPILIVFDPTPSPLLEKLKAKYVEEGGNCAIGDDAWEYLTSHAGREMGRFILKYIKPPISKLDEGIKEIPDSIRLLATNNCLVIENNSGQKYEIPRI